PRVVDAAARADLAAWLADARVRWTVYADALGPQVVATVGLAVGCALLVLLPRLRRLPRAVALACWTVLLVVPLLLFGWRFNPMQYPPVFGRTALEQALLRARDAQGDVRIARILLALRQALPANTLQLLGVDDVHGASAAGVSGFLDLAAAADDQAVNNSKYFRAFRDPQVASTRLLDLLNVGLVLANAELPPPYEPLASEDGLTLYANPRALPRFYVVEQADLYATREEGRARLLAPDFDPARRVLLSAADDAALPPAPRAGDAAGDPRVTVRSTSAHAIRLRVVAPRPAILVSSEVAYPGWRTLLDGEAVPTLLVDTAFRGVALPAGEHEVEMVYVPRSFHAGVALSAVSLLLVALVLRPRRGQRARGA
ncbi:MAG: YfhO family protein, partial [Thermodesulfobacteriota bacterium]